MEIFFVRFSKQQPPPYFFAASESNMLVKLSPEVLINRYDNHSVSLSTFVIVVAVCVCVCFSSTRDHNTGTYKS